MCIYQEVATCDSQLTVNRKGGGAGGGNIIHICLNSYYITSGAQRRAANIYFYPRSLGRVTYNVAAPGDTWGLLNNQGILIRNQELKQFKAIKIDGLIGTCNKCGLEC